MRSTHPIPPAVEGRLFLLALLATLADLSPATAERLLSLLWRPPAPRPTAPPPAVEEMAGPCPASGPLFTITPELPVSQLPPAWGGPDVHQVTPTPSPGDRASCASLDALAAEALALLAGGMSQKATAARLGVSLYRVRRWIHGARAGDGGGLRRDPHAR